MPCVSTNPLWTLCLDLLFSLLKALFEYPLELSQSAVYWIGWHEAEHSASRLAVRMAGEWRRGPVMASVLADRARSQHVENGAHGAEGHQLLPRVHREDLWAHRHLVDCT